MLQGRVLSPNRSGLSRLKSLKKIPAHFAPGCRLDHWLASPTTAGHWLRMNCDVLERLAAYRRLHSGIHIEAAESKTSCSLCRDIEHATAAATVVKAIVA